MLSIPPTILIPFLYKKKSNLNIGLVADPQYANKPSKGKRHYRESLWKLKEAIDSFNDHQVDFIQNLGDIIDDDWESFDSILPVYDHLVSESGLFLKMGIGVVFISRLIFSPYGK